MGFKLGHLIGKRVQPNPLGTQAEYNTIYLAAVAAFFSGQGNWHIQVDRTRLKQINTLIGTQPDGQPKGEGKSKSSQKCKKPKKGKDGGTG